MRDHVDLQVTARGATAVEYTLRAPARAASSWRVLSYLLWVVAASCATSWQSQPQSSTHHKWWLYAAIVACVMAIWIHIATGSVVIEESVLVVPSLGIQLSRRTRSGATTQRFIDASDISAVVVNEGFVFSDVVYYIAFLVHSNDDMVLAFEHFQPRIAILQEVFMQMRQSLFPDESTMRLPHIE